MLTDLSQHGLGAIPVRQADVNPDHLRLGVLLAGAELPVTRPSRVDLSSLAGPIRNQGGAGTCVGFATATLAESLNDGLFEKMTQISPLYIYNRAKQLDGVPSIEGTYVSVAMNILRDENAAIETDYPYDATQAEKGFPTSVRLTSEYRIDSWATHWGLDDLRTALATTGPCVIAVAVLPGFDYPGNGGTVDIIDPPGISRGYHAVCAYGYDDDARRLLIKNQWGEAWGDRGWGRLSYDYVERYVVDSTSVIVNLSKKILGDEDGDSRVTVIDAHIALMMAAGSRTVSPVLARVGDLNMDGKIDVRDAIVILRQAVH